MPMYNLLEYSKNYRKTTGSLFNYYRDELTDQVNDNNNPNKNFINSNSFKYKTSITGNTYNAAAAAQGYDVNKERKKDVEIAIPLKYLGNFWRNLDMPLINCEVSLTLSWYERCVITTLEKRIIPGSNPQRRGNSLLDASLEITDCKLYVPVVTLLVKEDTDLLDQLKSGFKRTIKWNKYVSQMSNQTKNNDLNYLIGPTFTNVNRLYVLSFENEDDRTSFSEYYVPKVEIKDYNVIIDGKSFFELPVKNKEETYEKIIEVRRNNNYTTGNLLDYEYFKDRYKLFVIDLSKQRELENSDTRQQINLIGKLDADNATMFFFIEKKEKTTIKFSQNSATIA